MTTAPAHVRGELNAGPVRSRLQRRTSPQTTQDTGGGRDSHSVENYEEIM